MRLAVVGLAVADLWALRTGRRQEVAIDACQATASLRSGHCMQMDKAPVSTESNTVIGVYPAKNGRWSYSCDGRESHWRSEVVASPHTRENVASRQYLTDSDERA